MSSLLEFLQKEKKLSFTFWFKYYWNSILNTIYEKKVSNKVDNSWKVIKVSKTITPEGWTSENAFQYLNEQYKGKVWKRK